MSSTSLLGHLALGTHGDMGSMLITIAEVLHEKLLDGDALVKHHVFSLIGAAETTCTYEADYLIFTSLKEGSSG